jgi:hypothetical protein
LRFLHYQQNPFQSLHLLLAAGLAVGEADHLLHEQNLVFVIQGLKQEG